MPLERLPAEQGLMEVVEQTELIGRELGELAQLGKLESKQKRELIRSLEVIHSWLGQQVRLEVRRWGGILKDVSAAYLGPGGSVLLLDWHGNPTTRELDELDTRIFLAIVQDATSRLLRSVMTKVEETNRWRKPEIKARIRLDEGSFLGLGKHLYCLSLSNSGGSSRDLRVSVRTTQRTHSYGPVKLGRNQQVSLDLRRLTDIESTARVPLELTCRDVGERRFHGATAIKVKSENWQRVPIFEVHQGEEGGRSLTK